PPPNVCISLPPHLWRRQTQIFQTYNTGEDTRKSDFAERIETNEDLFSDDGAPGSQFNVNHEIPGIGDKSIQDTASGILGAPEIGAVRTGGSSTVEINSKSSSTRGGGKHARVRSSPNSRLTVDKMRTKRPAKYGGCIPAILHALDTVDDLDDALRPWATTLTAKERSILLKEQHDWERASKLFDWFRRQRSHQLNVIHYNIMLRVLGKAKQWRQLQRLWNEMEKVGIEPVNSTYGTLIDVCCKGGLMEDAIKWLDLMTMNKVEPDEVTIGIVVQMYKMAGDFVSAERFFKKHRNCVSTIGDDSQKGFLSSSTYNTLIDTYGKAGKLQEAYDAFETMLRKGIVPTTVTFNTLIHMYGIDGQLEKVASLIQRMDEAKCRRDTRTYNILIFVHAKHDDIELATLYFREMKEASLEPDAVSYRTLLYAYSMRHMVVEAEELVSEMDDSGLEIDEFSQSSLSRMYIQVGMLKQSWSWFSKFHLSGKMTSSCYSAIIDAYGEMGYVSEARRVFDCSLQVKRATVLEFNVMVKAYGIGRRFEEACSMFDSMGDHGLVPDRCGYNCIVQMLAGADMPDKAASYLGKMQESETVSDCIPYSAVISSYIRCGNRGRAVELYDEMIALGVEPDAVVFGTLINAFAETGSVGSASRYVEDMRIRNVRTNPVICRSLIKLYAKVGYLREAREVYDTLESLQVGVVDAFASNCMIDLYSRKSMIPEAEAIFERLDGEGAANEFAHAVMLCMYRRNARFSEAYRVARKMREEGLMKEVLSCNHVIGLYSSDGRYKEAVETFEEMLESGMEPDDSTFRLLGSILTKRGVPKCGIEKLRKMSGGGGGEDRGAGFRAWCSTLRSVVGFGIGGFEALDSKYVTI
ncbi:hypothetical protein M569_14387, partial [Genlisea aurea]